MPGPTLSLVTIDRIPFPRPDDPVLEARRERAGPGAFSIVDLPRAGTLLAQGAGRLIRSATDRGVVAVLDSRLATARYRGALLARVPADAAHGRPGRGRWRSCGDPADPDRGTAQRARRRPGELASPWPRMIRPTRRPEAPGLLR